MGDFMGKDDPYIPGLLELMSLRFAPSEYDAGDETSGVVEMAELQKKFQVFDERHSFRDSVAVLNLTNGLHPEAKAKWYRLLDNLKNCPSDEQGQNGNDRIVKTLKAHLEGSNPGPVYFASHDGRRDNRVIVRRDDTPLFYIERPYLTISLPMRPRRQAAQ